MNTALKRADLLSLFNKDYVSFSGGWCWGDHPYWGQVGEVVGIIPPTVKTDVPHDQYSTEYWFYFAAVSRYISYAATMNGEVEQVEGFERVCNKLTEQNMRDSIENSTPLHMLLTEYDLNMAYLQPDLTDFYVIEYKTNTNPQIALIEREWTHNWLMNYVKGQLDEKAMCERCSEREYNVTAHFNDEELGSDEQRLCYCCFDEVTAIESAWVFTDWYKHTEQEQWSVNSKLTDSLREGYDAYCKEQGVVPYWDAADTTDEVLEIGDFVEVAIPFTWAGDEQKLGNRFVIKEQHVNQGFERWVKKVS